jgi:6,7-dimethyl-8-ribityllumazine synthase
VPSSRSHRWAIVASRFNEAVVDRLVAGAMDAFERRGHARDAVNVVRVPGAFEVPQATARLIALCTGASLAGPRIDGVVALAAVVRGQTPHFDHICTEVTRALMDIALQSGVPIGYGVLTCDTMEQALARAGGERGNKGAEAAAAVLDMAALELR